jgi:hypothetical protein
MSDKTIQVLLSVLGLVGGGSLITINNYYAQHPGAGPYMPPPYTQPPPTARPPQRTMWSDNPPIFDPSCATTAPGTRASAMPHPRAVRVRNPETGRCSWYVADRVL